MISINLDKAKEIHKDNIRKFRKKKFEELDLKFQQELEKESPNISPIVEQKQVLRDLPADPIIEQSETVEELKNSWPSEILGNSPYTN